MFCRLAWFLSWLISWGFGQASQNGGAADLVAASMKSKLEVNRPDDSYCSWQLGSLTCTSPAGQNRFAKLNVVDIDINQVVDSWS